MVFCRTIFKLAKSVIFIRISQKFLTDRGAIHKRLLHFWLRVLGAINYRSSHQSCSVKIGVLRSFTKFTGKHMCQSLFFNNVAGLRPATLLKKEVWYECFLPVNLAKFLRTPFLQNTSGQLLLKSFSFSLMLLIT